MEFDSAYNLHCELKLDSGRSITLNELIQFRTYGGLLEGTPDSKSNDRAIERALKHAQSGAILDGEPFLIEPDRQSRAR